MNSVLKQEFVHILKENLMFHLSDDASDQENSKKKRDWVRRMYVNLISNGNKKNKEFKNFVINIMKENNCISDNDDFGDFELLNDLNKFREEEQMKRSKIEMELHENFKKIAAIVQTETV